MWLNRRLCDRVASYLPLTLFPVGWVFPQSFSAPANCVQVVLALLSRDITGELECDTYVETDIK